MKATLGLTLLASLAAAGVLSAQTVNIAPQGAGIMGYNTGDLTTTGTNFQQFGSPGQMNDNDFDAVDNTYGNSGTYSYAGMTFNSTQDANIVASGESTTILSLNLYLNDYGDGGWFGPNGVDSRDASGGLTASDLTVPLVQTQDSATGLWTTIGSTDNYVGTLTGAQGALPEVTFTLDTPVDVTTIGGIRLIGTNGSTDTFIGVRELQVEAGAVPEPATYAMMFAGLAFLGFCLRRKIAAQV